LFQNKIAMKDKLIVRPPGMTQELYLSPETRSNWYSRSCERTHKIKGRSI